VRLWQADFFASPNNISISSRVKKIRIEHGKHFRHGNWETAMLKKARRRHISSAVRKKKTVVMARQRNSSNHVHAFKQTIYATAAVVMQYSIAMLFFACVHYNSIICVQMRLLFHALLPVNSSRLFFSLSSSVCYTVTAFLLPDRFSRILFNCNLPI
jgi:hypothetical protein